MRRLTKSKGNSITSTTKFFRYKIGKKEILFFLALFPLLLFTKQAKLYDCLPPIFHGVINKRHQFARRGLGIGHYVASASIDQGLLFHA